MADLTVLTNKVQGYLRLAENFQVESLAEYEFGVGEIQTMARTLDAVEEARKAQADPLYREWKAVNTAWAPPKEFCEQAIAALKGKLTAWKLADDERVRKEQAELDRLAAEQREKAAAEAREREQAALQADQEAEIAAAAGDQATAEAKRQQAATLIESAAAAASTAAVISAPVVQRTAVSGFGTAKKLTYEVTDMVQLVKHIAEHPELITMLEVNSKAANGFARGFGLGWKIPGLLVKEDTTARISRK